MVQYTKNNKEKLKSAVYKWRKNNYQRWKENANNWTKEQLQTNLNYKLAFLLRKRVGEAFNTYTKNGKLKKSNEYGIDYLKIICHLISTFPKEYYLKKYHIDHIKPLCSFNLENPEEIIKAFSPENHQWLTAEENLKKVKQDKLMSIRNVSN